MINLQEETNKFIINVQKILNELEDGNKINIPQLADQARAGGRIDNQTALALTKFVIHNTFGITILRGRTGGIYKGNKIPKSKKVKVIATGSTLTDKINGVSRVISKTSI